MQVLQPHSTERDEVDAKVLHAFPHTVVRGRVAGKISPQLHRAGLLPLREPFIHQGCWTASGQRFVLISERVLDSESSSNVLEPSILFGYHKCVSLIAQSKRPLASLLQ
jgi:hypothetical protein